MTAEEVGKRIKYLREKKNLKKNTLANLSGVSPTYIDKLENGERCPTVEYLDYICFGLGITPLTFRLTFLKFSPFSISAMPATTSPSPLRVTAP